MVATRAADAVDVFHRFSRYVRNIPMSAVLDRGGLQQRWVAVNLPCFWMFPDFFFLLQMPKPWGLGSLPGIPSR